MNYCVDGEFTNDDFKFNKKDQLFSSIYSSKNSSYDYLELDLFTHQNIVYDSCILNATLERYVSL